MIHQQAYHLHKQEAQLLLTGRVTASVVETFDMQLTFVPTTKEENLYVNINYLLRQAHNTVTHIALAESTRDSL